MAVSFSAPLRLFLCLVLTFFSKLKAQVAGVALMQTYPIGRLAVALPSELEDESEETLELLQASTSGDQPAHAAFSPPVAKLPVALVALSSISSSRSSAEASDQSSRGSQGAHDASLLAREKEVPAGWFGAFTKDESTFDVDGVADNPDYPEALGRQVRQGDTVNMGGQADPAYRSHDGVPAHWFEESKSGGPTGAWRTGFPPLEGYHRQDMTSLPLHPREFKKHIPSAPVPDPGGVIARVFDTSRKKDAPWFDESMSRYDAFGRNSPPSEDSARFYWRERENKSWEEQSWNVSFGCATPGCVSKSETLKTFDAKKWQHARCRLSVGVHVTDYDDEYSREFVEYITVNGAHVSTHCDPGGHGCNSKTKKADRGLHPCVTDLPIDSMLQMEGTELKIAGKISEMVDECPVGGNLLSGVARVTCMVRRWPALITPPAVAVCKTTSLQCGEHGCTAKAKIPICREQGPPEKNEKCFLNVSIWQTDFDNDHGSEIVEFVKVNGKNVSTDIKPGRNPCKEVFLGKPSADALPAALNGGPAIGELELGLDAQSRALLAPLADETQTPRIACRRRLSGQIQDSSLAHRFGNGSKWSNEATRAEPLGNAVRLDESSGRALRPGEALKHSRAAPDEMKQIVTNKDVTKEVSSSGMVSALVEAKISRLVDECAKDGYLLNAQVSISCKR